MDERRLVSRFPVGLYAPAVSSTLPPTVVQTVAASGTSTPAAQEPVQTQSSGEPPHLIFLWV